MTRCARCGTETGVYQDGSSICVDCTDSLRTSRTTKTELDITKLNDALAVAHEDYKRAKEVQLLAAELLRSNLKDPQAMVALTDANAKLASASHKFRKALREFVEALRERHETNGRT